MYVQASAPAQSPGYSETIDVDPGRSVNSVECMLTALARQAAASDPGRSGPAHAAYTTIRNDPDQSAAICSGSVNMSARLFCFFILSFSPHCKRFERTASSTLAKCRTDLIWTATLASATNGFGARLTNTIRTDPARRRNRKLTLRAARPDPDDPCLCWSAV